MDRVAFTLFGIDIMWYGILMACGMILGTLIAIKEAKRVGIKEDDVLNIAIIAIPVGLICARICLKFLILEVVDLLYMEG